MVTEDQLFSFVDPQVKKHVAKKFSHYSSTEELNACFSELLKFLYLSSKYSELRGNFIPVTQEVDNVWHELILQTAAYQRMCSRLPGGKFIHHESMALEDYRSKIPKEKLVTEILRWIPLYVENFGEIREDRLKYWFFMRVVSQTLNLSLADLNRFALDAPSFVGPNPEAVPHGSVPGS